MSTVKQIEAAIPKLSRAELEELRSWLENYFRSLQKSSATQSKTRRSVLHVAPVPGKWVGERVIKSGELADEMFGAE